MIYPRISDQGFLVGDFGHLNERFIEDIMAWIKSGRIKLPGEQTPRWPSARRGLIGLFRGYNSGKMPIRVADFLEGSCNSPG